MALEKDVKDKKSGGTGTSAGNANAGGTKTAAVASATGVSYGNPRDQQRREQQRQEQQRERKTAAAKTTEGGTDQGKPYAPGAVPNFPEADALTVFEKIVAPLIPGVGTSLGLSTAVKMLEEGTDLSKPTTVLGGDPGPQRGWRPDQYRGADSLTGIGGSGGAVNSGEREIAGRPLGAGSVQLTDEQDGGASPGSGSGTGADYSDVMLKDRRKPYSGLKQMLESML